MGIVDVFMAEDKVDLKVSQLIRLIDDRARAEAQNEVILKLCKKKYFQAVVDTFCENEESED